MILQLGLRLGIVVVIIAFIAEYVDSTLGMGYGTALTPILLLLGFDPLEVVPAVLLSEFITGITAGFTHHSIGNVSFKLKTMSIRKIIRSLKRLGIIESLKRGLSLHLKIVLLITSCSIIGAIISVPLSAYTVKRIQAKTFRIVIGFITVALGILTLLKIVLSL